MHVGSPPWDSLLAVQRHRQMAESCPDRLFAKAPPAWPVEVRQRRARCMRCIAGKQTERELIARLHQTKEDIPKSGILIDATAPIAHVVDEIVRQSEANK